MEKQIIKSIKLSQLFNLSNITFLFSSYVPLCLTIFLILLITLNASKIIKGIKLKTLNKTNLIKFRSVQKGKIIINFYFNSFKILRQADPNKFKSFLPIGINKKPC